MGAWVKAASFNDFRILDKNQAGSVNGVDFDIFKEPGQEKGFIRVRSLNEQTQTQRHAHAHTIVCY